MHDMRTQTQQAEIAATPERIRDRLGVESGRAAGPRAVGEWHRFKGAAHKSRSRAGYGIPPPDTGNLVLNWICTVLFMGVHLERRIDPFIRPPIDQYLRDPLSDLVTRLVNMLRKDEGYKLAEERIQPDEEAHIDDIVASFTIIMRKLWNPGNFERGGNTKTHGIVRAEFTVRDDLPEHMRRGIFAKPATYKAWVRYSGPGPYVTPDIDDVGFMSMAIKLMGVPGPKLMDDEKFTQDLLCTSAPTFVSPDTRANAQLHHWSMKNAALIYFFNPKDHHLLDTIMQSLWTKTQTSPLEDQYFSCVPYLLGEGQAMQYSFKTRLKTKTPVPRLPLRPRITICGGGDGRDARQAGRRVRHLYPAPDRSVSHADRERRRDVADQTFAARAGGGATDSSTDLRFPRTDAVCAKTPVQSVPLPPRAPPAGQRQSRPQAHVLGARPGAAQGEHTGALRTDGRRNVLSA